MSRPATTRTAAVTFQRLEGAILVAEPAVDQHLPRGGLWMSGRRRLRSSRGLVTAQR